MKAHFILYALVVLTLFSCKDTKTTEQTVQETTPSTEVVMDKNNVVLSNYSDENWVNGVGIKYPMFLTDYSKEKLDLLKSGKEIVLADGTVVPYVGTEISDTFIQILVNEIPTKYSAAAEYPNVLTVK